MKLTSKVKLQPTGEQSDSWQPGGNIMGYDGPDPDNCQTVEDLERNGYKKRR